MTARIDRLWPEHVGALSDDDLVADLAREAPYVRVNFVSSVDGSATHGGLSGGLSGDADKRYFELLRRVSDVVLVGAGTVRDEGYGPMRVSAESARWRSQKGLGEHPVFAIVSRSLVLDRRIFTDAPVRPIVFTVEGARAPEWLQEHADVVVAGETEVNGVEVVTGLTERGLDHVLCEGGPHLFASLLEADVVDELCLTVSPILVGGAGPRITAGLGVSRDLELASVLHSESALLLRYAR